MITFLAGIFLGNVCGVVVMALCQVAEEKGYIRDDGEE